MPCHRPSRIAPLALGYLTLGPQSVPSPGATGKPSLGTRQRHLSGKAWQFPPLIALMPATQVSREDLGR